MEPSMMKRTADGLNGGGGLKKVNDTGTCYNGEPPLGGFFVMATPS